MHNPVEVVVCGGCNNGFIGEGADRIIHAACEGSGARIPKSFGRPVKAKSRRGQASPWVKGKSRH